jgi:hypothetical protein
MDMCHNTSDVFAAYGSAATTVIGWRVYISQNFSPPQPIIKRPRLQGICTVGNTITLHLF